MFWASSVPAEFYWTGGAFLRQDWLFLLVAAVCLAKKRKFGLAGAALTWSALLRIFPVLLFIGWVLAIGLYLLKKRRLHPDHKRLIAGCAIGAAVLVPGSMVAAGVDSYPAFFEEHHQPPGSRRHQSHGPRDHDRARLGSPHALLARRQPARPVRGLEARAHRAPKSR